MSSPQDGTLKRYRHPQIDQRVSTTEEPLLQDNVSEPVVELPHLPAMGEGNVAQSIGPDRGEERLMTGESLPSRDGRGVMSPVPSDAAAATGTYPGEERPQQVSPGRVADAEPGGYLRLRLRVAGGQASLVDVTRVEGPLSPPEPLYGGLAYEVTLGQQQLGAGAVPDPGVRRAFPPPDRPDLGHFVEEVPYYEFTARVPFGPVTTSNLQDLRVTVYRLDATQMIHTTPVRPLYQEAGRLVEEVAALRGVRPDQLPHELRTRIDRALR